MGRYGGSLHSAMANMPLWTVQLWERSFLALQADFLKGSKFVKKLTANAKVIAEAGEGSTDPKPMQLEDRALRECCTNAVVISMMSLQQREHQRVVGLITSCSAPLDLFYTTQNRQLRSVTDAESWLTGMVCGG